MRAVLLSLLSLNLLYSNSFTTELLDIANTAESNKDYSKAIYYYKEASKDKSIEALVKLGTYYYQGQHVKKGYTKAYNYFQQASNLGSQQATYYLGVLSSNKKTLYYDLKKAFKIFTSLEKSNYAPALNRLGMFYTYGMANKKDYKKAVTLYENASKQGFETAHCNLAYMYASGKGVWQNMGRAHAFAKDGYKNKNEVCMNVWKVFNLEKYPEDKGWKFKFYNKPNQ